MKLAAKLLVCLGLACGVNAQAASVTYYLDQSNVLTDGIGYVKVTISNSSTCVLSECDIDFKVETTSAFSPGSNFGIQAFGFNPSVALSSSNFYNLNSAWSVGSGNLDGFGSFAVTENGTGSSRQNPLTFSIAVAGDSISSYANPSTGTAGSWTGTTNPFFAAHVAGFTLTQGVDSAFFAGSTTNIPPNLVPVPAAAWLLGSGLIGLAGVARRKTSQRSA
jgi:hypothetical protein